MQKIIQLCIIFVFSLFLLIGCEPKEDPNEATLAYAETLVDQTLVHIVSGDIQGVENSISYAWLGIPYAKAPNGNLRWKAPKDPDTWKGIKKTNKVCNACVQYGNLSNEDKKENLGKRVGSEDCLFLNVWRPKTSEKNLPVYVFIHGGGNLTGNAGLSFYDGANFAERNNCIFVSMNYRLGYFGWFSHPALREGKNKLDDSGNYGTLDIIKSLEWVKKNIESFGGNPNNVTISGQSAGCMNVHSMMVSPLAKGLFHRAVMFSGFNQAVRQDRSDVKGMLAANRLLWQAGKTSLDPLFRGKGWTRDFLRGRSISDVYPNSNTIKVSGVDSAVPLDYLVIPEGIMGINIDGYVIPRSPLEAYRTGNYNKVPVMIGCTSEEFKVFTSGAFIGEAKLYDIIDEYQKTGSVTIGKYIDARLIPLIIPVSEEVTKVGKIVFQAFGVDTLSYFIRNRQENIYAYKFCWNEEPFPFDIFLGAFHAVDLPFWFNNLDADGMMELLTNDVNRNNAYLLSDQMTAYLGNFMTDGNPNGPGLSEWTTWSNTRGENKRMILDSGKTYMSPDFMESIENVNWLDMLKSISKF
jgi:para-nitrobenzyl esterase